MKLMGNAYWIGGVIGHGRGRYGVIHILTRRSNDFHLGAPVVRWGDKGQAMAALELGTTACPGFDPRMAESSGQKGKVGNHYTYTLRGSILLWSPRVYVHSLSQKVEERRASAQTRAVQARLMRMRTRPLPHHPSRTIGRLLRESKNVKRKT